MKSDGSVPLAYSVRGTVTTSPNFDRPPTGDDASGRFDHGSWGSHVAATLALGLPLIGAQLAQLAINVTDTVMIGWLGPEPLAAAVLSAQIFFLVWMFGAGFAQGVLPMAASAAGRGDTAAVRRSVRMGLWFEILYAALVMIPLWHLEPILLLLGQAPRIASLAGDFMHILQWGMFPALIVAGLRSYLAVVGRAHVVLLTTIFGALVNGILNYALIFGHFGAPALGMPGAAIASVTANGAMALATLAYTALTPELSVYRLYSRFWRPDRRAFLDLMRIGWPISTTIIAEVGLFATASIMMGWLGAIELAAHGIALQLASITFMFPLGLANAATVRVGLAYGRGEHAALGRAGQTGLLLSVAISAAGSILFLLAPGELIGLYLDRADPNAEAVVALGIPLLAVAAAFQIFDGLQVVASGILRGIKDTRVPMIMAIVSYWAIGMPTAYGLAFGLGLGGPGIWWGLATGLLAASLMMTLRFLARQRLGLMTQSNMR